MADVVGAGLSDEKEAENDEKRGEKCVRNRGVRMGEINTKDMAETLSFYQRRTVRKEQHDTPGEFVFGSSWLNHHFLTADLPTWLINWV